MTTLAVQYLDDGVHAKLLSPMTVIVENAPITIPAGFVTDFASTPQFLQNVFPRNDLYTKASVMHDYLYSTQTTTRAKADRLFLELMKQEGVPAWKRWSIYLALRVFGWSHW